MIPLYVTAIGVISPEGVGDPFPPLNVRTSPYGAERPLHAHVVDLFAREIRRDALCVCLDCGKTWPEGADYEQGYPPECKP
jgi:hypothetical protein